MAAVQSSPAVSRIEAEVLRTRDLLARRSFAQSLAAARALLAEVPENRDVLYLVAVSLRYLGRIPEALASLARFEKIHPGYGRLFQERGHCHRALGDASAAIAAYQQAVALNAALPASWKALHELLKAAGRTAQAAAAADYLAQLTSLPVQIVSASSLLNEGELFEAERLVRGFLQTQGNHIEGMRLLAQIGVKLDVLDDAEFLLESILEFAPAYHVARYEYALVLSQRQKHSKTLEQARILLDIDPQNRAYQILQATACVGLGEHEQAIQIYRGLVEQTPGNAELHLSIAHALKTLGKQPEAIESYRNAARHRPSYGDAYWSLANLKTYRFTDEEIAGMRAQEAAPDIAPADRYHLCFALGKALEDREQYAESFHYYDGGNALKKSEIRFKPELMERNLRLQSVVCTREFFAARQGVGCPRSDPIFIVGLPRSGSTLLEQILASHSQVEGTMELADISRLAHDLQGRDTGSSPPRYPAVLAELDADRFRQFGERYIEDTRIYRRGAPFFIDKMPNNFRHIGLIHLILPNARIIDARREPMACCFSNFKQLFATGQEFTYSLEDIARYYRNYIELMAHWHSVLPGKILQVQHEDLVEDLEAHVRRLLEFCGLDFEPACLEFHKTERSIRTASSEQVRRPIFKEGLDQWRNFEPWLEPLKNALGPLAQGIEI